MTNTATARIARLVTMSDGETLSPQEAAELNRELAGTSVGDIPLGQRRHVADYIVTALNINSVDHSLVSKLEALLDMLQNPST